MPPNRAGTPSWDGLRSGGGPRPNPCIERNVFGAVEAITAASRTSRATAPTRCRSMHCFAPMRQSGLDMSDNYKETSLAVLGANVVSF
ncbi:L-serine ammonia-lyase, iron-sulfur-dependent, subunit alpha [Devosia psychrophila]|nr:L-serine ammonia-lyase, iron-sulfur-dependent, subunit alpha [Devosia psychrophila]